MVEARATPVAGSEFVASSSGGALVWRRFRRERLSLSTLIVLVLLVLACFAGEPLFAHLLGHGPDTFFPGAVNVNLKPVGPWSWVPNQPLDAPARHGKTFFLLGADGTLGRDEFLRILAGGRLSLEISFIATALALVVGVSARAIVDFPPTPPHVGVNIARIDGGRSWNVVPDSAALHIDVRSISDIDARATVHKDS
jgi:N-terminal TM domain of oligopeptide transport permease C/Peptidase dimerisation domain